MGSRASHKAVNRDRPNPISSLLITQRRPRKADTDITNALKTSKTASHAQCTRMGVVTDGHCRDCCRLWGMAAPPGRRGRSLGGLSSRAKVLPPFTSQLSSARIFR